MEPTGTYSRVMRIEPSNPLKDSRDHDTIYASASTHILSYARDMTLARGYFLYEIWDVWYSSVLGYIVPREIYVEALKWQAGPSIATWNSLPLGQRTALVSARRLILDRFPQMPGMPAKMIATAVYERNVLITPSEIELAVVEHVKTHWTTFCSHRTASAAELYSVMQLIKPRMREVLEGWMKWDTPVDIVAEFWRRHGLFDVAGYVPASGQLGREAIVIDDEGVAGKEGLFEVREPCVRWYAGAEMSGNLVAEGRVVTRSQSAGKLDRRRFL